MHPRYSFLSSVVIGCLIPRPILDSANSSSLVYTALLVVVHIVKKIKLKLNVNKKQITENHKMFRSKLKLHINDKQNSDLHRVAADKAGT